MTRYAEQITFRDLDDHSTWSATSRIAASSTTDALGSPESIRAWIEANLCVKSKLLFFETTISPIPISTAHGPWVIRYVLRGDRISLAWFAVHTHSLERLAQHITPDKFHREAHTHTTRFVPRTPTPLVLLDDLELARCESFDSQEDLRHYRAHTQRHAPRLLRASPHAGKLSLTRSGELTQHTW